MRPTILRIAACLLCVGLPLGADDQPPAQDAGDDAAVLIYPVRNTSPDQITASLRSLFGDTHSLRIVTAPNGKTLLIRVDTVLKDGVLKALEGLDPPARRLAVQVALIRRIPDAEPVDLDSLSGSAEEVWNAVRDLERARRVHVSDRMQTTTLSGQQTMIMSGQQRPVISGMTISSRGTSSAVHQYQNVGTILTFQGRTAPDGAIILEIGFEKSELVEIPDMPIAEGIPGTRTDTTSVRSTVSLQSGTATLLSAAGSTGEGREDSYLILSATALESGDEGVAHLFERGRRPAALPATVDSAGRLADGVGGRFGAPGRASGSSGSPLVRPPVGLLGTVSRDEVATALELTETQQAQLKELVRKDQAIRAERTERARDVMERMRAASSDEEREKIRSELASLGRNDAAKTEQKLAEILSSEDFARLKQLDLQYSGYRALIRDDIASTLKLTEEQMSQIRRVLRGGFNNPRRGTRSAMERQWNEEVFAALTDEQRQAWLKMVGEVVVDNGIPKN